MEPESGIRLERGGNDPATDLLRAITDGEGPRYLEHRFNTVLNPIEQQRIADVSSEMAHTSYPHLSYENSISKSHEHLAKAYQWGFTAGHALYYDLLSDTNEQTEFWDQLELLSEAARLSYISKDAALADAYVQAKIKNAERIARELSVPERNVIQFLAHLTGQVPREYIGIERGVTFTKEAVRIAQHGPDLPEREYVDLSKTKVINDAYHIFLENCLQLNLQSTRSTESRLAKLHVATEALNTDPYIYEHFYPDQKIIIGEGSLYIFVDEDKGGFRNATFNHLAPGSSIEGLFKHFQFGPIASEEEVRTISQPTIVTSLHTIKDTGLYMRLNNPMFVFNDENSWHCKPSQHVLLPLNYSEQQVFCQR